MKKLFILLSVCVLLASCETEQIEVESVESVQAKDLSNGDTKLFTTEWDGLSIGLDLTSTYDYDQDKLNQVIEQVVADLYAHEFDNEDEFFFVDIFVGGGQIIVTPGGGTTEPSVVPNGDEKCGGKEGDGWKSYGKCYTEECVKEKSSEAATKLGASLESGEFLDIRVKRNTLNARVCGRIVKC